MDPKTGRAAILFPHGVLFRQEEKELREKLVTSGMLEAVIGLGAGLFYNSPMEAVVVILRNGRPESHNSKVLFINAVDLVTREKAVSFLSETHQGEILSAYRNFENRIGLASVKTFEEIKVNNYSLAIPLYVEKISIDSETEDSDMDSIFQDWFFSTKKSEEVIDTLLNRISLEMDS
jgi:type I restriction enzyme M protein